MAAAVGKIGGGWGLPLKNSRRKRTIGSYERVRVVYLSLSASALADHYKTLRIYPGASESEVKKAFRKLALQAVMSDLRGESTASKMEMYEPCDAGPDETTTRGMNYPDWELWEEWMGWEGAGIRDYSSHINPYI
ncbi:unnamed protein product [Thlaspi arvense]|uniref:J domain-containing protein n=1 Tax=Thlaspi arvense TaxID=13288 RepID=A0AAU9RFJ6_THLAR|nr:unnamed protein product [Thlaspi arvense]